MQYDFISGGDYCFEFWYYFLEKQRLIYQRLKIMYEGMELN